MMMRRKTKEVAVLDVFSSMNNYYAFLEGIDVVKYSNCALFTFCSSLRFNSYDMRDYSYAMDTTSGHISFVRTLNLKLVPRSSCIYRDSVHFRGLRDGLLHTFHENGRRAVVKHEMSLQDLKNMIKKSTRKRQF